MRLLGRGVRCVRGGREVFSGLDFEASTGQALAVTGRNGSGKTSLLRLIAGLLTPAEGSIELEGGEAELTLAEQAHYLGHRDALKPALSVEENLIFWRDFLGGEMSDAPGSLNEDLATVGLDHAAQLPAAYLSAGQRRRLSLARLIAVRRPVWLLDEPTAALDAGGQSMFARAHARSSCKGRDDRCGHARAAGNRGEGAADRGRGVISQDTRKDNLPPATALSVPSPLAGEGQGGGCGTAGPLNLASHDGTHSPLPKDQIRLKPFPGLPPSPTLPRTGGGSRPDSRSGRHSIQQDHSTEREMWGDPP